MKRRRTFAFLSVIALGAVVPGQADAQSLADRLGDPSGRGRAARVAVPRPSANPRTSLPAPPGSSQVEGSSAATLTRLRALDASFSALASAGGPDYVRAILSMVGGAASIVFGAITLDAGPPWDALGPYLVVLGGTSVVRTIFGEFILRPNPSSTVVEYANMPASTNAQRLRRLRFGEEQLASIAEASLIARVTDGALSVAGALAIIPAYLVPRDFMVASPLEALIFLGPAISLVQGILTLATPSAAERRWDAYRELRERIGGDAALEASRREVESELRFELMAGAAGGAVGVSGAF